MTPAKRVADIALALLLLVPLAPVMCVIALLILLRDGRPVLYPSERMRTPSDPFTLLKFRTMSSAEGDTGVSGGDKATRITPTGARLRKARLDELPQLLNILKGDMSFVGPRPPLRRYTEMFPELYGEVLRARPGVTGLATLLLHHRESRLLDECRTAEETEAVYTRRCIPPKAKLDLLYRDNRTLCWDMVILLQTLRAVGKRRR
ncbi:Sugar transferase involved in LPS biosynthesis (colanic, teichoic acid) [Poseidonocella pacifica]|uniref:Sugar transferase involved in LPS biosynthesis (Colanic, teichoic acid) n=1 Tax=Poseidonocella pacifica TaxID=871651 RepID=A0A1I0Y0H0_9RHOB|nr:sugar transferase [Poseidonocella pacifica]SFB06136.1 Sugar transferase involved in LPS biosynthesis (colanic, teichoic acid) [Poseidonocella pacifica]